MKLWILSNTRLFRKSYNLHGKIRQSIKIAAFFPLPPTYATPRHVSEHNARLELRSTEFSFRAYFSKLVPSAVVVPINCVLFNQ